MAFSQRLLRQQCLINGIWQDAMDGTIIAVTNPSTGDALGSIPHSGRVETKAAIEAAHRAFQEWRTWTAADRAKSDDETA